MKLCGRKNLEIILRAALCIWLFLPRGSFAEEGSRADQIEREKSKVPEQKAPEALDLSVFEDTIYKKVAPVFLAPESDGHILIDLRLTREERLLSAYPAQYSIKVPDKASIRIPENAANGSIKAKQVKIPFVTQSGGGGMFEVHASYGYCASKNKMCMFRNIIWRVPYVVESRKGQPGEPIRVVDEPQ